MDIHICGTCRSQFTTIEDFIAHKNVGCSTNISSALPVQQNASVSLMPAQASIKPYQQEINEQRSSTQVSSATSVVRVNVGAGDCLLPSTSQEPDKDARKKAKKQCADSSARTKHKKLPGERTKAKQYLKQFKCSYESCKFITAHRKDLLRHERIHTGEKPFACRFCQSRFSRDDKRKLHERKHTNEKPFKCLMCDYVCAYGASMKKHIRIHTDERPFQCQLCSYASRNSSQLMVHLRRHTGDSPFHCQRCDAKFKTNTDLKRHVLVHTGEKPFSCEQCSYKSHLKCNLKSHIASNHQGTLKYECEHCSFKCRTKRQLSTHSGIAHVGTKFQCSKCLHTASGKAALDRHMRKHSVAGPFTCKYCQYTAKRDGTITTHIRKKHPEKVSEVANTPLKVKIRPAAKGPKKPKLRDRQRSTVPTVDGKRPYKCTDCEASFVREDSFRSHRRQHDQNKQNLENAAYAVLQLQDLQYRGEKQSQSCDTVHVPNTISEEVVIVVTTDSTMSATNQGDANLSTENQPVSSLSDTCISENENNFPGMSEVGRMDNTNKNEQSVASFIRPQVILPPGQLGKGSTSKQGLVPMQSFEMIQGDASSSSVNPSAESIMNVLSRSDNDRLAHCSPDLTQISLDIGQGLSTEQTDSQESTSLQSKNSQASKQSIKVPECCSVTVQNPNAVNQQLADHQKSGNSIIQTETLGYGTSNFPVFFTSLTSASQPNPSFPLIAISSQSRMISGATTKDHPQHTEPVHRNITHPSNDNLVSAGNLNIGGLGTVRFICPNNTQQQQQQPPQQQTTVVRTQLNTAITTVPSKASIPCKILPATVATTNFDHRVASSAIRAATQQQRQPSLQMSSIPTGSFILNGRAISRGTPPNDTSTAPCVTTPSQTPQ